MATNFFDQFDAPKEKPEQKTTDNFFDQFDAPTEASLTEEAPKELDSAWDFSGERTFGGLFLEGNKAVPRGAINTLLDSADFIQEFSQYLPGYKLAEVLGEKALDATGRREEAEINKQRALAVIPEARKFINEESGLKADDKYADLWTTKLGSGAGSLLTFIGAGGLGKAALSAFAATTGGGTQVQKLRQAEEAGEDISETERTLALTMGAGIGLLETYTPLRLLKAIPKNIPAPEKAKIIGMVNNFLKTGAGEVVKTGVGEGSQEVASSILQSLVEMGYNPNAELPTAESLWDDFTIGAVLGGGSQAIRDVVVQNRTNAMSETEIERERKAREYEDGQNALLRMKLEEMAAQRELEKSDPAAFAEASQSARAEAFKIAPPSEEEVKQFNAPSAFGPVATPSALGELYGLRLVGALGQSFPSNTSFSVKEIEGEETPVTNPDGTQGVAKNPVFAVVDGDGNQYGQVMQDTRVASSLASTLNKEVQSKGIRGSILDTLMVSPEGYSPEQTDKLFRYGFRTLSPDSNRVTFAALNDAAGTTTENGYIEDLPLEAVASVKEVRKGRFEVQMPDGNKRYIAGLTASQKLNLKRVNEGLPPVTTFDIAEARDALGGDVGRLALPGVSGIQDSLSYGAKVLNGKPVVVSEANEVITQRKTTGIEKVRAGVDEDGKSVLPDYIEFKTLDEAKRYAGRLNQRAGASRVMPSEILEGKKGLVAEIKRLLEAKNIASDVGSPEINQLVQAFTGANSFKEMTADDRKLFYNRVRNLPKFEKLTKIPVFKQKLYTPEQFVQAVKLQNDTGYVPNKEQAGRILGLTESDPNYDAATQSLLDELNRQNEADYAEAVRGTEEVLPIHEEMLEIMSSFGMSPFMLNLGVTLKDREGRNISAEAEGYYDPAFEEIKLAIDAIDPKGELTQEQRVNALKGVLSHEVLHALRAMDMFTQKEYALLETAVARTQKPEKNMTYLQWARRLRSQGGYFEDSPTVQVEEAIADMVRDFIVDKRVIGGKPRNLIERIIKFFQKVRNMMDGYGFKTFDEVIAAIQSGEVGRRYKSAVTDAGEGRRKFIGPVRSLRASEQMLEKAGQLPARYQKFGDIFAQGPTIVPGQVAQERVPGRVIQEPVAGQAAPVSTDFDPAALEGAEVRMSRKAIESSKDWAYSPLMKAVEQASPKITTAQQWSQWLDANGPKLGITDEIDFSGIKDFLALKEGKVSKEDINGYLDNNGVVVKDVMKQSNEEEMADFIDSYVRDESSGIKNGYSIVFPDGTMGVYGDPGIFFEGHTPEVMAEKLGIELPDKEIKYQSYTIPGGENYRELLLTLPAKRLSEEEAKKVLGAKTGAKLSDADIEYASRKKAKEYSSAHWNEPNILAHIRMDDRVDQNGDKVLFIEEIQSDWAQEGRKEGFGVQKLDMYEGPVEPFFPPKEGMLEYRFKDENENAYSGYGYTEKEARDDVYRTMSSLKKTPEAPFVTKTKNWVALALKRILALAENEGYKKVAFINGEQSSERYDLSKTVDHINYEPTAKGYYINVIANRGGNVKSGDFTVNELEGIVGKEIVQKMQSGEGRVEAQPSDPDYEDLKNIRRLTGTGLKFGGEGMKSFYDQIVPQVAKEVIKKVGGKNLSEVNIDDIGRQLAIEITSEMSERIAAGQVLFSRKAVPGTAEALPDTIDVDGVQRPAKNNEGKDIFPTEEGIRNFWRWFGDSDVVDEQGRPIVYYHGTKFPGQIDEFKSDTGMYWATPSPDFASKLATGILPNENVPSVLPVYVRSLNAFDYKNPKHVRALSEQVGKGGYRALIPGFSKEANKIILSEQRKRIINDYATHEGIGRERGNEDDDNWSLYEELVDDIRALGFDGFHVFESGVDNIASFDNKSLKSAMSNIGTYDANDSRIRYSRKNLQGEPKIPFEVAPSPDNKERTAAWRLVPHSDKVKITQTLGQKAVREASKILGIDSAAFEPIISGQGLFEGHVNPNQILGIREQFLTPDEVLEFASVLGRILEQKAMIAADGRMTGRDTSVIRIQTKVSSPKVADRIYAALTAELGDLGGYTAYKNHIDVFNFTNTDSESLGKRFVELLNTSTPDIKFSVSHDTIQSAYLENESYDRYIQRKKSANQERLERGIESARSRIIGELETSIRRTEQRSDGQRRVRRQAPQTGRASDAIGGASRARSLQEVKGPEWLPVPEFTGAETIPAFTQRKVQKDAVSAFAVHYSQMQGLMALDSAFAGSGSAGGERRRFGMGVYGSRVSPGDTARRLYFYVQSKMDLPGKEDVVTGNATYRVRLDNLYDVVKDPLGLKQQAGVNPDLFEELVNDAGYDGAVYPEQPGIEEPTVVLFGLSDKVPVRPYNEPLPEQPVAPISEEQAAEAVAKAENDTQRTGKGAVPLYGKDASPEALYIAQNPETAATLTEEDKVRYSRKNTPIYSPKARQIIDKNTPRPPDETMGKSIIEMMGFPNSRDMWDALRQAAVFRYGRLERQYRENIEFMIQLADTSAVAGVEMADQSRRFTNEALRKGVIVYENGMTLIKDFYHNGKKIDGLIGVMAMLHTKEYGNLEELAHAYATAVRGERLNAEGKLTPVSPGELAELKKEVAKFINPKTGKPVVEEWFNAWQDYNSYTVKFLRDTGILDDAGAELWAKQADYVPFYREDSEGNLVHPRVFGGLHTAGQFKAVGKSDKAINVDMVTAITNNIDTAIAMGMKNVAQQRVIRDQIKLGLAHLLKPGEQVGKRAAVSFKVSGKRYTAIIEDPLIYESMLPVSEYDLSNILGKILTAPANFFREIIIRDPGYQIANMFRDTLSAYVITGANIVPIVDTVRNIAADISQLEKLGVVGSNYDLNLDRKGVRDFYEKHMRQTQANAYWHKPWLAVWDGLGRLSERSEAATRMAVYNDVLKRTGNMAEAQYQALSVMNYGRRGGNRMMRLATAVIPFLNARMQGLDKLYQAFRGRVGAKYDIGPSGGVQRTASQQKNYQRFAARAAIITAMTVLYYSMIEDDDEYLTASPEIRDNYYIIPLLKGDVGSGEPGLSMKLPIPFEIGILFKVIPERLLAMGKGEDTPRDFAQSMTRQVKSTLGVNLPQAMLPLYEAYVSNNDSFTGRPVIPTYMENLLPEQQQSFYTNQAIAKAAEAVGMSPMKAEHVISGYMPGVGAYFLQALDSTVREFQGDEMAKPALQWFQYPVVKRFFTTANQPGLQNQFYDLKDQVDGITQTMNKLEEQGRYEELAVFYAKNGHKFDMRSDLNALERQIGRLRDERKIIEQMPIDPEDKRELIEQLNMQINASLLTVPMYRQEAFGEGDRE